MSDTSLPLHRTGAFRLGAFLVSPAANEIDGVRLDPKAMNVLVALAEAAADVVSVAELLERVWFKSVVGDNVVHQAVAHVRKALGDDPRAPRYVQSIPRRGYRLIAAVERTLEGRISLDGPASAAGAAFIAPIIAPIDIAQVAPAEVARQHHASPQGSTAQYILAVLAFDNLSDDAELAYFSDGMSDEIRDAVTRGTDLKVIGRASSFQFRGAHKAAAHVATQVNATHVLDGAVRRHGQRVRVSAELVDCVSATTLWSERFDRELTDIFALQDEIASAVAEALRVAFAPSPQSVAIDPDGFDLFLRARAASTDNLGAYDTHLLEAAVAREPRLTQAWAALSLSLAIEANDSGFGASPLPESVVADLRSRAYYAVDRAFELDADAALAHAALAALEPICGAFANCEAYLRTALGASPNDPTVLARMSRWCRSIGRVRDALTHSTRAFEIDPLFPAVTVLQSDLLNEFGRGAEAEALIADVRDHWPADRFAIPTLWAAAQLADWQLVDRLLVDIRERGSLTQRVIPIIEEVQRMRDWSSVAGDTLLANLRLQLAETGTVSLHDAVKACGLGLTDDIYPILFDASFDHLFHPSGRLLPGDYGLHWLFGHTHSGAQGIGPLQRDVRFVELCARFGLCDYWVKNDTWPDCAEQLSAFYDFKAEAQRALVSG